LINERKGLTGGERRRGGTLSTRKTPPIAKKKDAEGGVRNKEEIQDPLTQGGGGPSEKECSKKTYTSSGGLVQAGKGEGGGNEKYARKGKTDQLVPGKTFLQKQGNLRSSMQGQFDQQMEEYVHNR